MNFSIAVKKLEMPGIPVHREGLELKLAPESLGTSLHFIPLLTLTLNFS